MITKDQLKAIIQDQEQSFNRKNCIERRISIPMNSKRIVIISGIRQCGKSTLLRQKLQTGKLGLCINFEDPRLAGFVLEDFPRLEELMHEYPRTHLLLDEVQNIDQWERYARMANEKGIPLYITGSNARMLSRELGTRLTGRYRQIELFPFSFQEYLDYFKEERSHERFSDFFRQGGFPGYLEEPDQEYHRTLLKDIISRDIALRKNITNENQLMRLATYMLSNIGKEFSYNKIAQTLEFKSVRTVIDYLDYCRESYLMDYIPRFSYSIKKQQVNPKKAYAIDPALAHANSLSLSEDLGRRLENVVYNKLRRESKEIYYFRGKGTECDFLVKQKERIVSAVQSCWKINADNIEREVNGLKEAMKEANTREGMIITMDQEDIVDGIRLIPAWRWL